MGVVNGIAEFFNLSNASAVLEALGGKSINDLGMNVQKTLKGQDIVSSIGKYMTKAQKTTWAEDAKDLIVKKGMSASDASTNVGKMVDLLTEKDGAYASALAEAQKNEAFAKALEEYQSKRGMENALEYFGRETQGNIAVKDKLIGAFADPEYGRKRVAIAAGTYAGTALAVRTLSGGNLTTNARGEHDIAGIPIL